MSATRWWLSVDGQPTGPLTLDELGSRLRSGEVSPRDLACAEGKTEWQPLGSIPELSSVITPPPAPPPPPPGTGAAPPQGGYAPYPPGSGYGPPSYPAAPRGKSKAPMILVALLGIVILGGIALLFGGLGGDLEDDLEGQTWAIYEIQDGVPEDKVDGYFYFEGEGKALYWRRPGQKAYQLKYTISDDPVVITMWPVDEPDEKMTFSLDKDEEDEKTFILVDEKGREQDPVMLRKSSEARPTEIRQPRSRPSYPDGK